MMNFPNKKSPEEIFGRTFHLNYLFVCALLVILGIVVDPTTAGVGDSHRAMGYEEPYRDKIEKWILIWWLLAPDVNRYWSISASAGNKCKGEFQYCLSDADISTYEEIEEIQFRILVFNDDDYSNDRRYEVKVFFNQMQE